MLFTEHHESHAASAFYPVARSRKRRTSRSTASASGRRRATASAGAASCTLLGELRFPHSLGLLYSRVHVLHRLQGQPGEYKVMGLAPYGEPRYVDVILRELVDLKEDGSIWLNQRYFNYCQG